MEKRWKMHIHRSQQFLEEALKGSCAPVLRPVLPPAPAELVAGCWRHHLVPVNHMGMGIWDRSPAKMFIFRLRTMPIIYVDGKKKLQGRQCWYAQLKLSWPEPEVAGRRGFQIASWGFLPGSRTTSQAYGRTPAQNAWPFEEVAVHLAILVAVDPVASMMLQDFSTFPEVGSSGSKIFQTRKLSTRFSGRSRWKPGSNMKYHLVI